jgi:hypothetical protein
LLLSQCSYFFWPLGVVALMLASAVFAPVALAPAPGEVDVQSVTPPCVPNLVEGLFCELRLDGVLGSCTRFCNLRILASFANTAGMTRSPAIYGKGWCKTMYVAVRRYEGVSGSQKVAQLVEQVYVPIISEMPGFVAYYWVDAGDGVIASTSVFEHKDAEERSNFRAGEFVAEHLAPLLPNPPQVTAGEVDVYKAK